MSCLIYNLILKSIAAKLFNSIARLLTLVRYNTILYSFQLRRNYLIGIFCPPPFIFEMRFHYVSLVIPKLSILTRQALNSQASASVNAGIKVCHLIVVVGTYG